jgi:hypothetical protein
MSRLTLWRLLVLLILFAERTGLMYEEMLTTVKVQVQNYCAESSGYYSAISLYVPTGIAENPVPLI